MHWFIAAYRLKLDSGRRQMEFRCKRINRLSSGSFARRLTFGCV
jgi:hypothetical protein